MSPSKIHADQLDTSEGVLRRLLANQFPQWVDLPVGAVPTSGTENAIYRLGDQLVVRLPYRPVSSDQLEKLETWLPRLAARLPLAIPRILARGAPSPEFPAPWSITRWFDGEEATLERLDDPVGAARTLAEFVRALMAIDATDGPSPGAHNFWRGVPLAARDEATRRGIAASTGLVDAEAVARAWARDLAAPRWNGPPTWLHGDLAPDNLLVNAGVFSAVIDWGCLGVGDPAIELLPAWNLFRGASRRAYREALGLDDATWARGRGLALSTSIVALPYYAKTIPIRAQRAADVITEVLADQGRA